MTSARKMLFDQDLAMAGVGAPHTRERSERTRLAESAPARSSLDLTFETTSDIAGLAEEWTRLQGHADVSVFQSWHWIDAWCRTGATTTGERPLIVVGRDGHGNAQVILPLALVRIAGASVLTWLGQSHSSYNLPLCVPSTLASLDPQALRRVLAATAHSAGACAVVLRNQPATWGNAPNPMARISPRAGANDAFVTALEPEFQAQYQRLFSSRTRSTLRRKERKLSAFGEAAYITAVDAQHKLDLLSVFLAQKAAQLREAGAPNPFASPGIQALYRALAESRGPLQLDIQAVAAGGEIASVLLAVRQGPRTYMLNTSITQSAARDASPGQLLVHRHIGTASNSGVELYDFGPGDVAYKRDWAPEQTPLVDTIFATGPSGLPIAAALAMTTTIKAAIKRDPRLWSLACRVRQALRRR